MAQVGIQEDRQIRRHHTITTQHTSQLTSQEWLQRCAAIAAFWGQLSGRSCGYDEVADIAGLKLDIASIVKVISQIWNERPGINSVRYFWRALQETESNEMKSMGLKRHFGHGFASAATILPHLMG